MMSPFAGMDPYLERSWLDVQISLTTYSRDQLQRQLCEGLVARAGARPVKRSTQRYIDILDLSTGGRVITTIEFLSPSNKLAGDGLEQYQKKQLECRDAGVNLVEIDLTRAGRRQLLAHRWAGTRQHDSTWQISVWRAAWPARCELYPAQLRDPLPVIRIPLRPTDPDVLLDLGAIVRAAYAAARYDRTTDYRRPCEPPLAGEEAEWADQTLKAAGRR